MFEYYKRVRNGQGTGNVFTIAIGEPAIDSVARCQMRRGSLCTIPDPLSPLSPRDLFRLNNAAEDRVESKWKGGIVQAWPKRVKDVTNAEVGRADLLPHFDQLFSYRFLHHKIFDFLILEFWFIAIIPTSGIPYTTLETLQMGAVEHIDDVVPPQYEIRATRYGGRGVFALRPIPKDTLVLACAAPYASVVFRKFKREVCGWCFAYSFESGKNKWSIRLDDPRKKGCGGNGDGGGGTWFCMDECRESWVRSYHFGQDNDLGWWMTVNAALEKIVTQANKRKVSCDRKPSSNSGASPMLEHLDNLKEGDVTPEAISHGWKVAEEVFFEEAKSVAGSWGVEVMSEFEMDTVRFVLNGLITRAIQEISPSTSSAATAGVWDDLLSLQDNEYALIRSKPYILASRIRIYGFIKRFVQLARSEWKTQAAGVDYESAFQVLWRLVSTPETVRAILARDHGNVFGIWDTAPDDEESEMLGWGLYVFGSYFNHDCSPNLKKRRHKRGINFYTTHDVNADEELCISYVDVCPGASVINRKTALENDWFFVCQCARCARESNVEIDLCIRD